MKFHKNQIVVRVLGTAMGIGFLLVGGFSLIGPSVFFDDPTALSAYAQDRAIGFGIAAIVGGIWAIAVSWLDSDLGGVWCKPPKPLSLRGLRPPQNGH